MPIHSFLVHFPIACWLLGSLVVLVGAFARRDSWWHIGWFLLITGAVTAIAAVVSGQQAILGHGEVSDVLARHRDLGNQLPWPMGLLVLAYLHGHFVKRGFAVPRWGLCLGIVATCVLVIQVGHLGGRAVRVERVESIRPPFEKK